MKKKIKMKKIISVLMILILILQITPPSFAGLKINSKITLKSKGMLDCLLQYYKEEISDWSYKVGYYIYYEDEETNKKIPAICVEPSQKGVGELGSYDGTINVCNDNGVYTILYIYHNKKYTEWGLDNAEDYYQAVQTAMHCYADKVEPKEKYRVGDKVLEGYTPDTIDEIKERGKVVLNTAQSLYKSAIKKEYKQQDLKVSLNEQGDWKEEIIDGVEYYSKKYEVEANYDLEYCKIDISDFDNNAKIFTLKNKSISNNSKVSDKEFKVAIPKDEFSIAETIKGDIKINSATAKIPIAVYANSKNSDKQNYAVYTDEVQHVSTTKNVNFTTEIDKVILKKIDSESEKVLEGASFDIYLNKKDSEGNYILNDNTFIYTTNKTDSNGEVIIELENAGEYIAKEKEAPEGYMLSEEIFEFSVETGLKAKVIEINVSNEKISGQIEILKLSKEYNEFSKLEKGTPLEGAKYLIEDSNGNAIGIYTTNAEGKILTEELDYGEYKIYEIESPQYYNVNTEPQTVFIDENQKLYSVVFENESSKVELNIEKSGIKETEAGKTVEYEFNDLENNSNVPVDNFTWRDELPTDAVRLTKISTGTWNEELEYSIWYKTNLNEEYVMYKEGLNSKKNYTFKVSDIELEKNEYITEYEFRFGTVKSGFKEESNPKISCKVLENLENGYEFINNTYITATYFDEKIEVKDYWKTIIYTKAEVPKEQKLPKTGY